MIIDADTHPLPLEFLTHKNFVTDLDKNYVKRTSLMLEQPNINNIWNITYNAVRDPSWPDCDDVKDFPQLPLRIRKELKEKFSFDLMYISDDYNSILIEDSGGHLVDLIKQELASRQFCKVDKQLIIPQVKTMRMVYSTEKNLALKIMTAWNDSMDDVCQTNSFFEYTIWLAVQDIEASLKELERIKDRNFFAVYLDERMPWAWVNENHKIFEFCNEHKIPVYFHNSGIEDAPITWEWDYENVRYKKQKQIWPFDIFQPENSRWLANLCGLITEGLFDKYPDLRIIQAEKGTTWMRQFRKSMLDQGWPDPLPYFKKNMWFTAEPEETHFLEAANFIGWDRFLFATDYPHNDPGGLHRYKDVDLLNSWLNNGTISQENYDLITHKNYLFLKARK